MDSSGHRHRIVLCVTGLSPQVVTETVYALAVERRPPFVPTEVRVVTTARGAAHVRLTLLHGEQPWFARLCRAYDLGHIRFDDDCIRMITDPHGAALDDLRTPEDNLAAADAITEAVRTATLSADSAVHVSIAGGRKTMGFFAGYALSLYGRPQDRLSHVLVAPRFEFNPQFFFPTRESRIILEPGPSGKPIDARDAEVALAEIPFVRLRDGLNPELLDGRASFSACVAQVQDALALPELGVDAEAGSIQCGSVRVELSDKRFALYAWLAARRAGRAPPVHWDDPGVAEEFLAVLARCVGKASESYHRTVASLARGLPSEYFRSLRTRTHHALRSALGERRATPYEIKSVGNRPRTCYGLEALDPARIRVDERLRE